MRREAAGLTLIEVLVVVAIAAILLVIAVPSFTDSQARKRVEGIAGELHTDLQYAKSQAAATNQTVSFVTNPNGYFISSVSASSKTLTVSPKVSLTDAVTVTFQPYPPFLLTSAASIDVTHAGSAASLRVSVDALGNVKTCSTNGHVIGYPAC